MVMHDQKPWIHFWINKFISISAYYFLENNAFSYAFIHTAHADILIHLKTASIEIDVGILTHIIANKLNTCALHWYREIFHVVLPTVSVCFHFALHCFCFGAFYFIFQQSFAVVVSLLHHFTNVYFNVPLGFIARDTAYYIRHLHSRFGTSNVCVYFLVFHAICFIRIWLALICFILLFFLFILFVHSFDFIAH